MTPIRIAAAVLLAAALAACGGTDEPAASPSTAPATSAPATTEPTEPTATTAEPEPEVTYEPLPDLPASGAECDEAGSTIEMQACLVEEAQRTQDELESVQSEIFQELPADEQRAVNEANAAWLRERQATCAAKATAGGTIDTLTVAQCFVDETEKKLEAARP